ncbi:MAG TPA: UDP-glucuronic acid dehydrogenase [Chromatiaceae bacterium]|nr:UDP-glucuronic acid dehydrogenase [Chromatiaceae bacterium]
MNISIICSDTLHPIYPLLERWKNTHNQHHSIQLVSRKQDLTHGDILFLISCHEVIGNEIRKNFSKTLVIHASDLPYGRGWSPHIWHILEGKNQFMVSLIEAEDKIDTGAIWKKIAIHIGPDELFDEINSKLFDVELELMDFAIDQFKSIHPQSQPDTGATYYRKRTPEDSRIDPYKTISEQFDLIRISDPDRYPAFFDYNGYRYNIHFEKVGPSTSHGKN